MLLLRGKLAAYWDKCGRHWTVYGSDLRLWRWIIVGSGGLGIPFFVVNLHIVDFRRICG